MFLTCVGDQLSYSKDGVAESGTELERATSLREQAAEYSPGRKPGGSRIYELQAP